MPGRNDPCPCGSGAKFKKCCGIQLSGPAGRTEELNERSTQRTLEAAIQHFRAGHTDIAENLCRQVLGRSPDNPDGLHIAGAIAYRRNQYPLAIQLLGRSIQFCPSAEKYNTRGLALRDSGDAAGAVADLERALALKPDYADAWTNIGPALETLGQKERAFECYRKALALAPDCAAAHHRLARLFREKGDLTRALLHCRRCVALDPASPEPYVSLSGILRDSGEFEEAIELGRKALAIKPDHSGAYNNLAVALKASGRLRDALDHYEKALAIDPGNATIRFNRALARLGAGDLARGWAEYEWGFEAGLRKPDCRFPSPRWAGQPLAGKTILLWGEQGVGDEIFFGSMAPEVAQAAGACILECEPRLVRLFERSMPDVRVVPRTIPAHPETLRPGIDFQCPAGGLAAWFRTTLESFPQHGYLAADAARQAFWKERLQTLGPGLKVGICWRSKVSTAIRDRHYTTLAEWGPIFAVPGVHFVNLQYDDGEPELEAARRLFGTPIHHFHDLDLMNHLDEVAALTSALDLVVSVDTAVAAMTGALGKALWQFTLFDDDWATLGTDRIPWWPDVRLFRREVHQASWEPAILQLAGELAARAGRLHNR